MVKEEKGGEQMSKEVLKEIRNVSIIALALSLIQILITIPAGYFGLPALLGTLVGYVLAMLNFSVMGFILNACVSRGKGATGIMGFGYIARLVLIALVVIWSMKVGYLNYLCVIIPLIFPQISIFIINLIRKKERKTEGDERT